jgi:EAL domain-containing protein (putative c-di-GMP-specific phosphodiesterase class I)
MMINTLSSPFSTSIEDVVNYAARFRKQYAYIVVVLDHISEKQNHIDQLTSQLYPILKRHIRTTDTLIRFNQDAWVICLDNCDDRILQGTCYVIESVLQQKKLHMPSFEGMLTSVLGNFLETSVQNLAIKAIEESIELAKSHLRRGKTIRSSSLILMENNDEGSKNYVPLINQAILNNRLFIAFQPVVDSNSRELYYYECLARVLDDQGQILPAYHFIPQCERSGLIQLIDQKIQQLAIEELLNHRHLRLAINVSAITASDPTWLNTLKAQMTARPDLRGRLIIELTETSVFADIEESVQFMNQLQDLGCPISIDDFGAGYMSLAHIKSDLVQTVKIDAQFVQNLLVDSNNIHFIRALVALTQPYGIQCVAEGVENEETARLLASEKVDYLQGYFIGKPSSIRNWV